MKKTLLFTSLSKPGSGLLKRLAGLILCGSLSSAIGQTTIYSTDFGAVANVNPVGWTFTGIGMNISTNNSSTGYTGASGSACLGEGNSVTFTNTSGAQQTSSPLGTSEAILQVSTSSYSNVALSFGMRKSSPSYSANATYSLQYSTNGSTYTDIIYTEATAGSWGLASGAGLSLPLTAANQPSLYIKWIFVRTGTGSNFKIDDVTVTGNIPVVTPATISFITNDTTVVESVPSATVFLRLNATSTASSAISVSISATSNASASDYSLAVSTVTFAANAPANSTAAIVVNLTNDAIIESSEYIILRLSNPVNATAGTTSQYAFYIGDNDKTIPAPSNALTLNLLASFSNTVTGANSAEIVAHDPTIQRLYIANSIGAKLDVVDFVNPSSPVLLYSVPINTYGNINSVAVFNGTVAAAIENSNPQDSGKVVFFNQDGVFISQVKTGMMPDMITFNHSGTKVLTANEGEPNAAYTNDPDGSVTIVDISGGVSSVTQSNVAHATFTVYNGQEASLKAQGIRIYGPGANTAKDFEPEYVAVSKDDTRAWVTLQENNAVVEINIATASVTAIRPLGTKNHNLLNNGMDMSNTTKGINISNFPVKGFYLPDAIATYTVGGINYIITANEGDARAYAGFSEEVRISAANMDATKFPLATELKNNSVIGRLNITNQSGDTDNDGDLDTLYSYGARSFSIWDGNTGARVYDSGDDLETITSTNSFSVMFNASNANNTRKDRSDDKGPEPEGVAVGTIGSNHYAFIALERIGGVMVYDVTNPIAPVFVTYVNNRALPNGPDYGSEGLIFIHQSQSPNGQHLVIAANEISSTLSIWGIAGCSTPLSSSLTVSGPTTNICSANSPTLSVASNSNASFQWFRNGTAIPSATLNNVTANLTGNYSVAISTGTNCGTQSLVKTFSVNATPTLAITGSSAVCLGSPISQTVTGANTYTWSTSTTGSVLSVTPTVSASYSVIGTSTNDCISISNKSITVNPVPSLSISGPSTVCDGSVISQTITGANTYTWSNNLNGSVISFTVQGVTILTVTGTSTLNCSSSIGKIINVYQNPTVSITGTNTICAGQSLTLTANGASTYLWNTSATSTVINVSPSATTNYSVTGTSANGCTGSATRTVTVNTLPSLTVASNVSEVCIGQSATLTATGANTYSWNTGSSAATAVITPSNNTTYTVTGTGAGNCSITVIITQSVSQCTSISELNSSVSEITMYPNPTRSHVFLTSSSGSVFEVQVYNSIGALLISDNNYQDGSALSVENLAKGVYLIRITQGQTTSLKKLVIE